MPPKKTKPNEKCPCGSEKKYKKCCMIANQVATSTTAASSSSSPAANLNEMMEALSLTITTASATDMSACSHGSTFTHFPDGRAYSDVVRDYISVDSFKGDKAAQKFAKDHPEYFRDLDFAQYLFALYTSWYLKLNGTTPDMKLILVEANEIKYLESSGDDNKLNRYSRAICTDDDRGVINCLSRETKSFCNCMKEKKREADGMPKVETCMGCLHSFPRSGMKKFSGCNVAMFCTTEGCYDEHWPKHRKACKKIQQALIDDLEEKQEALLREPEDSHK